MECGNRSSVGDSAYHSPSFDEGLVHYEVFKTKQRPWGMTACAELEAVPVPTHSTVRRDDVSPNSHEVGVKNRREIFALPEGASSLQSVQGLKQTILFNLNLPRTGGFSAIFVQPITTTSSLRFRKCL